MSGKEIKVTVTMTRSAMYDFQMYHSYHSMSGIFGTLFGLFWIIFGIARQQSIDSSRLLMYIGIGIFFVLYMPVTLWFNASMQIKRNSVFGIPMNYLFDEEGITISVGDSEVKSTWEQVAKVCKSRKSLFIYTGIRNSFIIPLKNIGDQYAQLKCLMEAKVAKERRKGI